MKVYKSFVLLGGVFNEKHILLKKNFKFVFIWLDHTFRSETIANEHSVLLQIQTLPRNNLF